jgi:hypothetical protein
MLFWCKKSFLAFGCSANFPPLKDIFKFLNFEDIPCFYSISQQYLLTEKVLAKDGLLCREFQRKTEPSKMLFQISKLHKKEI